MVFAVEESQDCRGDNETVMFQLGRLFPLLCKRRVLDPSVFGAHVNLSPDHLFVEPEMALAREELVSQIHALDKGVFGPAPDVDVVLEIQQVCRFRRRRRRDMVLVHLVEMQTGLFGAEEAAADFGQFNLCMCQFPILVRVRLDGAAQHPTEELVSEADAAEAHLWSLPPQFLQQFDEFEDPCVVAMGIVHAPRDQDGRGVLRDLFYGGDVAGVLGAVFDDIMHVAFNPQRRVMLSTCLCEQIAQDVTEASARG